MDYFKIINTLGLFQDSPCTNSHPKVLPPLANIPRPRFQSHSPSYLYTHHSASENSTPSNIQMPFRAFKKHLTEKYLSIHTKPKKVVLISEFQNPTPIKKRLRKKISLPALPKNLKSFQAKPLKLPEENFSLTGWGQDCLT